MNGYWQIALILLAVASCHNVSAPPPSEKDVQHAVVGEESAMARFRLDAVAKLVVLVIEPEEAVADQAIFFKIYFDRQDAKPQSISLFPPDKPGRFAIPIPEGAKEMRVEVISEDKRSLPRFDLRLE